MPSPEQGWPKAEKHTVRAQSAEMRNSLPGRGKRRISDFKSFRGMEMRRTSEVKQWQHHRHVAWIRARAVPVVFLVLANERNATERIRDTSDGEDTGSWRIRHHIGLVEPVEN